jgi:hypothetical protein
MIEGQTASNERQSVRTPGPLRAVSARPWARELAVLVAFLAAGVAVTWPLPSYLAGSLPVSRDVSIYVWDMWWVAHQVVHLHNPWSTTYLAAPVGLQLGYQTLVPLLGAVMTPFTLAFGPSATYNLLNILAPGLACYAMYRAARLWLPTRTGAIAAGAFFGLSAMLTYQAWYHINIAYGTIFLPLTLEVAVRLRRAPTTGRGLILGVVLGASALVNQESVVMAAMVAVLALVPWLLAAFNWPGPPATVPNWPGPPATVPNWPGPPATVPNWPGPAATARAWSTALTRLRSVAVGAVTAAIVASPQVVAMIQQQRAGGTTAPAASYGYTTWVANLSSLFAPSPRLVNDDLGGLGHLYTSGTHLETLNTFGVVLSLLAVLGLLARWRRRSAWLLALLWLGGAALALGPVLSVGTHVYVPAAQNWDGLRVSGVMPYTWFLRTPGLSIFREADRLALLGLVGAALLAGAAVDWLWLRRRRAWPVIVAVAALGALEAGWSGGPGGVPSMPTALPALDRPIAADHSGSIVVDVPFGLYNLPFYGEPPTTQAILIATADGHPRAACYTSWVPSRTVAGIAAHPFYAQLTEAQQGWNRTPAQIASAQADLRTLHVGWVLVWLPEPSPALSRYLSATGFRFSYRADGALVYRPV